MRILRNPHFWGIVLLTSLLSVVYYAEYFGIPAWGPFASSFFTSEYPHDLHRALFVVPMLYAAIIFRFPGAIVLSSLALIIVLPYAIVLSSYEHAVPRAITFAVVASLAAVLLALIRERNLRLRQLASIVESSDDAIIGKTLDGTITSWNVGAERLYGYGSREMIGRRVSVLVPPGLPDDTPRILERISRGERVERYETLRVRKDGEQFHVALSVSPIQDGAGKVTGASSIARDISDRKRAEEAAARLTAELEQRVNERTAELAAANKELEAFSYSVSHDLRAPLRSMDGFCRALAEDYDEKLDAQGKDYVRRVRAASQRMGQLIDDLLGLSRVTRSEMHRETINISEMVESIAAELQQREPGREVSFVIEEGLVAYGDGRLLRIALQNLLDNAWKFSRNNARSRIEFGATGQGGLSAYFVRDNGVGFDMAYSDKLFDTFQRLHSTDEFEGTGIGLATVERIVRRHGGRIWAEGIPGEGATFYFTVQQEGSDTYEPQSNSAGGRQS